jgi:hypothetical protein
MKSAYAFVWLLVLAFYGCGDDEPNEAEPSEAEAICEDYCSRVAAAMCENADGDCLPACLHNAEPCLEEARAWLECNPTLACNQDGRPTSADCQAEWTAYGACAPG